jgi:hypothetical protein
MGTYVTANGLQIPTVETLLQEVAEEQRANIDPNLNTTADDPIGQVNGIFCSHLREAWEALAVAYNGFNPDAAEGFLLESLSALTGTKRKAATKSRFVGARRITLNLDDGTEVPAGSVVAVAGRPDVRFVTTETAINTSGVVANVAVAAEAEVTGKVYANAGTLTVIATPVSGWNSVTNAQDAEVGEEEESETQLRQRRERELRATGSGTVDAIWADVLAIEVEGVQTVLSASVLENVEDVIDPATGLPAHSFEVVVYDGLAHVTPVNTIAQTIWDSKPAGIKPYGSTSGTAKDAQGNPQTVPFTWSTNVQIGMETYLVVDPTTWIGAEEAKTQVAAAFNAATRLGGTVSYSWVVSLFQNLQGVIRIEDDPSDGPGSALVIGRVVDPVSGATPFQNLPMSPREKAYTSTDVIQIVTDQD